MFMLMAKTVIVVTARITITEAGLGLSTDSNYDKLQLLCSQMTIIVTSLIEPIDDINATAQEHVYE